MSIFKKTSQDQSKYKQFEKINNKSKHTNLVFLDQQNQDTKMMNDRLIKKQLKQKLAEFPLGELKKQKLEDKLDLEKQQQITDHIIDHKIKSNYDWIQLRQYMRQWRDNVMEMRLQQEKKQKTKHNDEGQESLANQLIKNEIYQNLQYENLIEENLDLSFLSGKNKKPKKQDEESMIEQGFNQEDSDFRMPTKELLQYIPYCTDIYLGND